MFICRDHQEVVVVIYRKLKEVVAHIKTVAEILIIIITQIINKLNFLEITTTNSSTTTKIVEEVDPTEFKVCNIKSIALEQQMQYFFPGGWSQRDFDSNNQQGNSGPARRGGSDYDNQQNPRGCGGKR